MYLYLLSIFGLKGGLTLSIQHRGISFDVANNNNPPVATSNHYFGPLGGRLGLNKLRNLWTKRTYMVKENYEIKSDSNVEPKEFRHQLSDGEVR